MRHLRGGVALALSLFVAGVAAATTTTAPLAEPSVAALHVPQADRRTADQTYLTFPEWFLVFSPNDYAEGLEAGQPASAFPFFQQVREFWRAYGQVIDATRGKYPFNGEYHTMIMVIGVSTTVEYGLKGAYEILFGRLSELTAAPNSTPEDQLATKVARDYVTFIRVRPWYEFDFVTPLRHLWRDTPASGPHLLRKWERRYLLTSEWAIKAVYAAALEQATHSAFAVPKTSTVVVVENLPPDAASIAGVVVRERAGTQALLELPRYQAFTDTAIALASRGARFREIAGNDGAILVSVVMPITREMPAGLPIMLRQPVGSRPGQERRVLAVPVARLSEVLARHAAAGDSIEHVFDY